MPAKKRIIKRKIVANQGFNVQGNNNNLSETSVTNNEVLVAESVNLEDVNQGYQVIGDSNLLIKAKVEGNKLEQFSTEEAEEETDLVDSLLTEATNVESTPMLNSTALAKAKELLGIKRMFLVNRKETIKKLRDCCDLLESKTLVGRYARIEEKGKYISASGKIANQWTFGIVEATGEGLVATNQRLKRRFTMQSSQAFKEFLSQEENNLAPFSETYNAVWEDFKKNLDSRDNSEPKLFSTRYQLYEVATNLWKDKAHLDAADMKDAINSLQTNYLELETELASQEQNLRKISEQLETNLQTMVIQSSNQFRY